jgi:hypothetical protein
MKGCIKHKNSISHHPSGKVFLKINSSSCQMTQGFHSRQNGFARKSVVLHIRQNLYD